MTGSRRADPARLTAFAAAAFRDAGLDLALARRAAEILVDADLRGIDTHGVMNLFGTYCDPIRNGRINAAPSMSFSPGSATTGVLDADGGLGLLAGDVAMQHAIAMAREAGSGWVAVRASSHCGAGAFYVAEAARQGMVGLHVSSGGTSVSAPGGLAKLIGNNIIACAAPAGRYPPFVLDLAPTMSISNKARMMAWDGEQYPEGVLEDAAGATVADPARYGKDGVHVLPAAAHKGFGLLLMIDILGGMLSGDGGSLLRETGQESHAFCALRIDGFLPLAEFEARMERMIDTLHAAPARAGQLRYPGEGSAAHFADRSANGIPLHPVLAAELEARAVGLGFDWSTVWREGVT